MLHFQTRFFAHRGLHGDRGTAPENSLPAFRLAVEKGLGIELDLRAARDHEIVVFHDENLGRVCGVSGRVQDYSYEELKQFSLYNSGEHIPLFSEVLALVDGQVPLIVEIKPGGKHFDRTLCEDIALLLDHYDGEYAVESFHAGVLYWFLRHRPLVRRGQLCMDGKSIRMGRLQDLLLKSQITNFLTKPDFVAFSRTLTRLPSFRLWRRLCSSVGWTFRSAREVKAAWDDFDYYIIERTFSSD